MNLQNAFVPAMMMCLAVLTTGCSRDPIVEGSDAGTCVEGTACQGSANPTAGSANPTTGPADPMTASEPTTGGGTSGAGASCGDGTCDAGEGCESCPGGCGACLPDACIRHSNMRSLVTTDRQIQWDSITHQLINFWNSAPGGDLSMAKTALVQIADTGSTSQLNDQISVLITHYARNVIAIHSR